jgi:hypothetical protein
VTRNWQLEAAGAATHIVLRHGMTEVQLIERAKVTGQDDHRPAHTLLWLQNMHQLMNGYPECMDDSAPRV